MLLMAPSRSLDAMKKGSEGRQELSPLGRMLAKPAA